MRGLFTTHMMKHRMSIHDTLKIIPFGDVHRDSRACDVDRWNNFNKRYRDCDGNTLFVGMGDYNDFASTSERRQLRSIKLHESTIQSFDDTARANMLNFCNDINHMRGKLIGIMDGNHKWDYIDSKTDGEEMAERFGTKYLGNLSYIRIQIDFVERNTRISVDLFVSHGKSGGKLAGTTFNKVDDMRTVCPGADIYIMGHDHRKGGVPITSLEVNGKTSLTVRQKRQWLCRSGSFLKGYIDGQVNYVSNAMLRPTDLGTIRLEIDFKRVYKNDGFDGIIKDIHCWS